MALNLEDSYADGDEKSEQLAKGPVSKLLVESRKTFFLAFGLTFFTQVLSIAPIVYMINMFDRVMTSRSVVTLLSLTVLLVAAFIFSSSVDWLRRRLMMRFALRLDWEVAADVFDASFRRFAAQGRVNVQQVMGDLVQLRKFFHSQAFIVVIDAPYAVLLGMASFVLHPWLGIYAVSCTVLMAFFAFVKARAVSPLMRKASKSAAETNRSVAEVLRHSETALALGMQTTVRSRWYLRHQTDLVVDVNGNEASGIVGSMAGFFNRSFPLLGLGLAVYLAISGEVSSGMAIGALFLIRRTVGPIQAFINQWPRIMKTRMAVERLDKLLAGDEAWQERMPLPPPIGHLAVENLTCMSRNGKRALLNNINFELHPGEVLAIVGASAAGKTTLARHLVGVVAPTSGTVRLDGADLHPWVKSADVPNLGYVPQDVMLLEGTVAENISRLQEVAPAAVVRAAEMVGMHKTILSFPDGYNTVLGSGEFQLTGGQKQRLLIARALYNDPAYIVLDEPSSSLDAESEEALLTLIRILRNNNITVIYTTHRSNLIAASDKVLLLEHGHQKRFGPTASIGKSVMDELSGKGDISSAPAAGNKPRPKALRGGSARLPKPGTAADAPVDEVPQ